LRKAIPLLILSKRVMCARPIRSMLRNQYVLKRGIILMSLVTGNALQIIVMKKISIPKQVMKYRQAILSIPIRLTCAFLAAIPMSIRLRRHALRKGIIPNPHVTGNVPKRIVSLKISIVNQVK